MTRTAPASAESEPAPVEPAGESHDRRRLHLDVTTGPIGTPTLGMRLRWFVFAVPAFTVGWAFAQVMGEVVGEAWRGDFLHLLGHAIGTVVVVGFLSLAGWLAVRSRTP